MSRFTKLLRRRASLALLPLSVIPFAGVMPTIANSHDRFNREHNMGPLPAPVVGLTSVEAAALKSLPTTPGEIPVIGWHGINDEPDGYSTSRRAFSRQLAVLQRLGYTAISMEQWADFRAGRATDLPAKPILLTFDDGRLDSYRGADRILERYGMRATMFVITGEIEKGNPFYVTWSELHRMQDSGRWDIEPHAHDGHHQQTVAPDGTQAPFYASRRYTRSQGRESLPDWEARVSADLFALREAFAEQGLEPHAFAVPYGDYGQRAENDPEIPGLMASLLTRQFGSFIVQSDDNDPAFTTPGEGAAGRYEMHTGTTLEQLYGWLQRHSTPAPAEPAAAPEKRQRAKPQRKQSPHRKSKR
jgi:peptidoglycan/xylan/chitin deacetylase (PgdA/CDA1 family)